ncbi:hypothetical protein QR680_001276 [Steinernema hermaphroditum]|uniref:Uncharacterized protein n=1 Tax=Steinernema hermaphroditum TaxID=289476 RepID=A0AA39GYG3_9BILA|nr:hypothetical protein QR680_001276 [Steinernema hermaphroditum]
MLDDSDLFDDTEELGNAFSAAPQLQSVFSQIQNVALNRNRLQALDSEDDTGDIIDEHEFRQGLARFRESQAIQGFKRSTIDPVRGEPLAIQSQCDKVLFEIGVEKRVNENNDEFYAIRGENMNHSKFVRNIDLIFKNQPNNVDEFVSVLRDSLMRDENRFKSFIVGTVSSAGEQDTLLRALILAKSTQIPMFLLVIDKLCHLADEEVNNRKKGLNQRADSEKEMALACIAHIRYINVVYDCRELFNCVFECPLETWNTEVRNKLIEAIPECFPEVGVQQDCLLNLSDLLVKGFERDSLCTRKTLLAAMKIMSASSRVRQGLRPRLLKESALMEPETVFGIVLLCMEWAQADDKGMLKFLTQVREHVSFEDVIKRRVSGSVSCTALATECLTAMAGILYMSGNKAVKSAIKFLSLSGDVSVVGTQDDEEEADGDIQKEFNFFDIMLVFALLNVPNMDAGVLTPVKTQINTHPTTFREVLKAILKQEEVCQTFQSAILCMAKWLMKTSDETVNEFGALLYEHLFLTSERSREAVINEMVAYIASANDSESAALLKALRKIVSLNGSLLVPYLPNLSDILKHIESLSSTNVRRVFEVLVNVSFLTERSQDYKSEIGPLLERYLGSASIKEKMWGILGLLVHLEMYLCSKTHMNGEEREKGIYDRLKVAQMRTDQFPGMRAEFYRNLAARFRENNNFVKSKYIMTWTDCIVATFKKDFTSKNRAGEASICLEDDEFITMDAPWISISDLLKSGRAVELIPSIELMYQLCIYQNKHKGGGTFDPTAKLHFLIEANLAFDVKDDDIQREECCDQLVLGILYLRTVLNIFSKCSKSAESMDSLLKKRFALMFECQQELLRHLKKLDKYRVPSIVWSGEHDDVVLSVSYKAPPSNRKAVNALKSRILKRKKPTEEEETELIDEQNLEDESERDVTESRESSPNESKAVPQRVTTSLPENFESLYIRPLEIHTIVDMVDLIGYTKEQTLYLLSTFRWTLNHLLPLKDARRPSWLRPSKVGLPGHQFHRVPDNSTAWKLIHKFIKSMSSIMNNCVEYLKQKEDESIGGPDHYNEMADTFLLCLEMFKEIFSRKDVSLHGRQKDAEECERRRDRLMMKMVDALGTVGLEDDSEPTDEYKVVAYFLRFSPYIPNVKIACALLELLCLFHRSEAQSVSIASFAWQCMLKEWDDSIGNDLKQATFGKLLGSLLEHSIMVRQENDRLQAMFAFIAKHVVALIPDRERESYQLLAKAPKDVIFEQSFNDGSFNFDKSIFPIFFKLMFKLLNDTVSSKFMKFLQVRQLLEQWQTAVHVFSSLALFIRVKSVRSTSMLTSALREGRRFLYILTQSSGTFLKLFESNEQLAVILKDVRAILKEIQAGDRALQCIGVDAKVQKNVTLLKLLPELRAQHEMFIRSMLSAFRGAGCGEAFRISLLKSRNMDGNEVVDLERSSSTPYSSPNANCERMDEGDFDFDEDPSLSDSA